MDDRPRRRHGDGARRRWARPNARERRRRELVRGTWRGTSSAGSTEAPRVECDWEPLKATYRRSLVDLAALRFSPPIAGGRSAAGRRAAVVHDDVRPRQHLHEPAGAAVHARARRDDAARARRLAGNARRRLPRRGPRPDPPRDALRRDDRLRGAPALAVLRRGRRHAALRRAARRVRALDGRPQARPRARARGAGGARTGSTSTPTSRATATSGTSAATRRPASRTSAGRTPGTRSRTATAAARLPARDLRAAGLRVRREGARRAAGTRDLEGPGARRPARAGGRRPQAALQPRLLGRGRRVLRARARHGRATRSTRSPRTTATCSGAASSTSRRRRRSRAISSGRGSSPAGACARSPRARGATTRSATTSAPSGRSTTRSSPGACGATASRTRPPRSPRGSSTPPSSSTGGCPRRSAATTAALTKYPVQYPTACSPQAWSTGAPLLLLRTMLGLEPHRRPPRRRSGAPERDRPPRAARHPRPLGPDRRLRPRPRRRRDGTERAHQVLQGRRRHSAPRHRDRTTKENDMTTSAAPAPTTRSGSAGRAADLPRQLLTPDRPDPAPWKG